MSGVHRCAGPASVASLLSVSCPGHAAHPGVQGWHGACTARAVGSVRGRLVGALAHLTGGRSPSLCAASGFLSVSVMPASAPPGTREGWGRVPACGHAIHL